MVIHVIKSAPKLDGKAARPIETEPHRLDQTIWIIFFGLDVLHFLALKSWFQEEARMWKSMPQVRQADILSTWGQDFLRDWSHGKMPRSEAFQQLAKHEPPLQCESFEVHGCLSCKIKLMDAQWPWKTIGLLCREWVNVFEKGTFTSRDTSDVAYVRNNFDVLTMLIDHWEPERRKTVQQVLAQIIEHTSLSYSVIYRHSSAEVEIHLHIVSPRSNFWIFMTQEPTEGFERWSNGLWDGVGASWCQWSDPMVKIDIKNPRFSFANEANWKLKLQCVSLLQLRDARPNGGIMFRSWNDDNSPNCNRVAS